MMPNARNPMSPETPPTLSAARPADLTDAEFDELDDLLEQTPGPLEPLDVLMLEGYLCATIVQPVLLEQAEWLPFVFDAEGRALPVDVPGDWRDRTTALVVRRHAALRRSIAEDGWFEPILSDPDRDLPAEAEAGAEDEDPLADVATASRTLVPWCAGFAHALDACPALVESEDEAVMMGVSRVLRHLPPETDDEREVLALLDREAPLHDADEAVADLISTVAELHELTRDARFRVETVRRETPKVGRNDPCPCGNGKKFKHCHGRS